MFDKLTQRRGTNSYKWDEEPDALPLWVADMDFEVAPAITDALRQRVDHAIFGYTFVPDSYYDAVISWFQRRHQWTISRESIQYTSGVVPALSCVIKALTMPGEKVIVMTPVYNCFFSSIRNNGCDVMENPLRQTGDTYQIDYGTLEVCCADEKATLLVLCNPHNPVGRVWHADELRRVSDICRRHHVRIVSDEIHCELVMPGHHYTPFATIDDEAIILCSPSKSFNTAGLQIANIVCNDSETRRRIDRAININEVCDVNPFGVIALQAAYNDSEAWLDNLNVYLYDNYLALRQFFRERLPHLPVTTLEGTYLVWVDIRPTGLTSDEVTRRLLTEGHVYVSSGTLYHGEGFIRLNIACPRARLLDGLNRIAGALSGISG